MAATMSLAFQRIQLANELAVKGGVLIVRNILAAHKDPLGLTSRELYKLALEQPPPPDFYNPHVRDKKPFPPQPPPATRGKAKKPMPEPPNKDHPVRSMAFLKHAILPYLVASREIQKTRVERILDKSTLFKINKRGKKVNLYPDVQGTSKEQVWVWKPVDPGTLAKPVPPKPAPEPFGAEVGVGEDIEHLSRKRQKARRAEIRRETHMMKVMEGIGRQKERSAAGAELRQQQALRKEAREQMEKRQMERAQEKLAQASGNQGPRSTSRTESQGRPKTSGIRRY